MRRLPVQRNAIAFTLFGLVLITGLALALLMPDDSRATGRSNAFPGRVLLDATALGIRGNLQSVYQVERGDTLFRIARQHNTTVTAILDANRGTTTTSLYVDQWLAIPRRPSL